MRSKIAPVMMHLAQQDSERFTDLEEQLDDYVRLLDCVKVRIVTVGKFLTFCFTEL